MESPMTTSDPAGRLSEVADLRRALETVFRDHNVAGSQRLLPPAEPPAADRAKIVVVGRMGTGKTSLINAVLRWPDFLFFPDPTLTAVTVAAADTAQVRVHCFDGSVVIDDDLDHLTWWLSSNFAGYPQHKGPRPGLPKWGTLVPSVEAVDLLEVLLDEPRLARMTLVDTPGIPANRTYWPVDTQARAAAATHAAVRDATALVFVCEATQPISAAELDVLAEAAERVEHVVFVLSKVDQLDDGGAQRARDNEETVRTDSTRFPADRFADLTFLRVNAFPDPPVGTLPHFGVIGLEERLNHIAARHSIYRQLNAMRAMKTAMSRAHATLGEAAQSAADEWDCRTTAAGDIDTERQRLDRFSQALAPCLRRWEQVHAALLAMTEVDTT
jgi:GTP-binding protein EngB required for normal cell division